MIDLSESLKTARQLKNAGKIEDAILLLKKIIESYPDYAPSYNNLANLFFSLNNFNDAIDYYQQALKINNKYIDAYYNLTIALHRINDLISAEKTLKQLLLLAPNHFAAHFQLASNLMLQNKFASAIDEFLIVAKEYPYNFEVQSNLGSCYLKLNNLSEAKFHYLKALDIENVDTQILFNLAVIAEKENNLDLAIQYYQKSLQLNPDFFAAHKNLGIAFIAKKHFPFALKHFKEALRLEPDNESIRYTVDALSKNEKLEVAPSQYIQTLFDAYADHYDLHLQTTLEYKLPQIILEAVQSVIDSNSQLTILDLGCGTGLCGQLFKPLAKNLIGVDLSEKMLEVARNKNIYDELFQDDIGAFLKYHALSVDLILAADVLVYSGDLSEIFSQTINRLNPDGLFAFNTEISETKDFIITQSGRFQHHKNYLDSLANNNNFKIVYYEKVITRIQHNEPVFGHLYVLKA